MPDKSGTYGISINALSDGGFGDRRTLKARLREYSVPRVGRRGKADLFVSQHVVDALRLHRLGLAPGSPMAERLWWLWVFEAQAIKGKPVTLAQLEAWRDGAGPDETPRPGGAP